MKASLCIALLVFVDLFSSGQCSNATSGPASPTKASPTKASPTKAPPSSSPTTSPTGSPTPTPTVSTTSPTTSPTATPTLSSTASPTVPPTNTPTATVSPTASNTSATVKPTKSPVKSPVAKAPTAGPVVSNKTSSSPAPAPSAQSTGPTLSPSTGITSFPTILSGVSYYTTPKVKWSIQLSNAGPGLAQLGQGNAVTVSPDGVLIYVTLSDGTLEVRKASNGDLYHSLPPPENEFNSPITCSSGVSFGTLQGIGAYLVYAITDSPPSGVSADLTSRVVAVSHPAVELLWVSPSLPGVIQGTPGIAKGPSVPSDFIMVTHNINTTSTSIDPSGVFSVLQANNNATLLFSEFNSRTYAKDPFGPFPYGPLGVAHAPSSRNYPGLGLDTNDVFVWTTSRKQGKSNKGYTFAFQLPVIFETALVHLLNTTQLNSVRWNAVARPTLSQNGQNLYVGVSQAQLRGWTSGVNFAQTAKWQQQLEESSVDSTTPIPNAPILSTDETRLYVSSPTPNLYGLRSVNGEILWTANLTDTISSEVKVAPDDVYVYAIQQSGEVNAFHQITGELAWTITCGDFANFTTVTCRNDTPAEFSLAPTHGLVLYYGDYLGNVKALQLGSLLIPTVAPTDYTSSSPSTAPSVPNPTGTPTTAPTTSAPSAIAKSESPSHSPSQQAQGASTPAPSTGAPSVTSFLPSELPSTSPTFIPITRRPTRQPKPTSAAAATGRSRFIMTVITSILATTMLPAIFGIL